MLLGGDVLKIAKASWSGGLLDEQGIFDIALDSRDISPSPGGSPTSGGGGLWDGVWIFKVGDVPVGFVIEVMGVIREGGMGSVTWLGDGGTKIGRGTGTVSGFFTVLEVAVFSISRRMAMTVTAGGLQRWSWGGRVVGVG